MTGVLTVVAKIHPKVGREAEVEALLVKMATAVRQHEPDCLSTGRTDPVLRQNRLRSLGERPCSCHRPRRGRLIGGRAVTPSALAWRDVVPSGGRRAVSRKKGRASPLVAVRPDGRCWITPPGGRSDDADRRLQESARPCPPPAARLASHPAHPSGARGECVTGDSTRNSGSGCGAGGVRSARGRDPDTRAGSSQ